MMQSKQIRALNQILIKLISRRLFLPLLLVWLIAVIGSGFFLLQLLTYQQQQIARSVSQMVDRHLDQGGRILDTLANAADQGQGSDISGFMESTWKAYKYFDTIYYLDKDQKVIDLVPYDSIYKGLDMSSWSGFKPGITGGVNISRPFISIRTGQPTVYISRPLVSGGSIVGELNLGILQNEVASGSDVPQRESIIILDQFGVLLAHPDGALVRQQTNLSNLAIFRYGLKHDSNLFYEYMGSYYYGSSTLVKRVGWVVVDQIAVAELLKPYALSTGIIIIVTFLIFMALVLNLREQLQRLVVDPLMQLSRNTTALAKGDYNAVNAKILSYDGFAELNKLSEDFQSMSVALEARQRELKESQEQYHSLFEQVPVGLFRFAADGTIITANKAFKNILRIPQDQGLSKTSIFNVCTYDPGHEQLKTVFEQAYRQFFEAQIHCADGALVWVLIRWSAVRDADSQVLYYDGTLADISERMQAQADLQQAKDELEVKVEQRTGELFAANQELKAMNEEIAAVNDLLEVANLHLNEENQLRRQELLEQTRSKNKYLEALHEISLGLLNQLDIDILLNNVVYNACELFETKDGYIALVDESGEMAELKIGLGHYRGSIGLKFRQNEGITGMVLKTGETKVVENYQQWPSRLNVEEFSRLQTGTAAPLKLGDKVIGVLSTDFFDNPRHFPMMILRF